MRRAVVLFAVIAVVSTSSAGVLAIDADGDGLGTAEELVRGVDPQAADTDGDGLVDGVEVARELDPLDGDVDDDDLADGEELELGTDPVAADSDRDGITDSAERAFRSDPNEADTDGDGLDDRLERDVGGDPRDGDTDGDGIGDLEEHEGNTDLDDSDTDGDGLRDGREMAVGTRPDHADSEYDGLDDAAELSVGTDPHVADTDGDGLDDRAEVEETEALPDADPLTRDIYVEVDSFGSVELPKYEGRKVVEQFQEAPVGPNGSGGWNLHLVYDDGDVDSCGCAVGMHDQRNGERGQYWEYRSEYFDREGMGYHYLLVVPAVDNYGMRSGYVRIGQSRPGYMLVEHRDRRDATGSIFMHELGHSLGLSPRDFDGIDSDRYTSGEYRSVMNYELHSEYYGYSSGEPFDDWRALEAQFNEPSTDELDRGE